MSVSRGFAYGFGGYFGILVAQLVVVLVLFAVCCGGLGLMIVPTMNEGVESRAMLARQEELVQQNKARATAEESAKKLIREMAEGEAPEPPSIIPKRRSAFTGIPDSETHRPPTEQPATPPEPEPKGSSYTGFDKLYAEEEKRQAARDAEKAKREAERAAQAELDTINARKKQAAAEALKAKQDAEAREKDAATKLEVAKKLSKANIRAKRLRELIEAYPGTAAAAEAAKLLEADDEK